MGNSRTFTFDGGAGSYLGTAILAGLLTLVTLGLGAPWATTMVQRWRTRHTYINGQRLIFLGSGANLFGRYIVWWFLTIITLGIYGLWVIPNLIRWITENTDFDPTYTRTMITSDAYVR
jgi:uncharacterized membrane protein YjgN (DUF898 family)